MKKAILALAVVIGLGVTTTVQASGDCTPEVTVMAQIQQEFPGATDREPDPGNPPYEVQKKQIGEIAGMHNGRCGVWKIYRHSILGIEYGEPWYEFVEVS